MLLAVERVPVQRALGVFLLVGSGCVTFHATVLFATFTATTCGTSGVFLLGAPKLTPSESWPGTIDFSAFGIAPNAVPAPVIEQRYWKCVFGLYDDGCQSTPPSADGAEPRIGFPVTRLSRYTQPVFDATPTAGVTALLPP